MLINDFICLNSMCGKSGIPLNSLSGLCYCRGVLYVVAFVLLFREKFAVYTVVT